MKDRKEAIAFMLMATKKMLESVKKMKAVMDNLIKHNSNKGN